MKKRGFFSILPYLLGAVVIFIVEVLIALYVHDDFIRPYVGDTLVVILICCILRCFTKKGVVWLPVGVFLFAVGVEVAQYFHIVDLLGLGHIEFFRILIGTSFAWKDIWSYGVGCILFFLTDWLLQTFKK